MQAVAVKHMTCKLHLQYWNYTSVTRCVWFIFWSYTFIWRT